MFRIPAAVSAFILLMVTSAQAVPVFFQTGLSGAAEAPPNASTASGYSSVFFDPDVHTMQVIVSFQGLTTPNTAAHIHCCTAIPGVSTAGVTTPVPTFPGFPAGTLGFYNQIFDMTLASSYNPAFLNNAINMGSTATAEATLFAGMMQGRAYMNIHSSTFPGGEIRGFLLVPEPLTLSLFGAGLVGAAALRRRRQRRSA